MCVCVCVCVWVFDIKDGCGEGGGGRRAGGAAPARMHHTMSFFEEFMLARWAELPGASRTNFYQKFANQSVAAAKALSAKNLKRLLHDPLQDPRFTQMTPLHLTSFRGDCTGREGKDGGREGRKKEIC